MSGFLGGGGGGGSSVGPPGSMFETGVREGDGAVTITFDPEAGGCPQDPGLAAVPVAAVPVAVVTVPRFTG